MNRVLLLLVLLCSSTAAEQVTNPARASYRVWKHEGGGSMSGGSSTGISPFLIVTNVHVVGSKTRIPIEVLHPLTSRKWNGEVVAAKPAADVALVFVSTGDLDWVEIGADPQPGEPCSLYGYGGGNSGLKRGIGKFLQSRGDRGNGVPVLHAQVESVSGDSGGGLFDESGRLVAVNWGAEVPTNESRSTPVSYVRELATEWLAVLSEEQTQLFGRGGCFGGQCPPPRGGGGYGGGGVMPPKQPLRPEDLVSPPKTQPQAPQSPIAQNPPSVPFPQPQTPAQPIKGEKGDKGDKGDPGEVDHDKLAEALAAKLPKPPTVDEIVAKLPKQPTIDEITDLVIARLPKDGSCKCPPPTSSSSEHVVVVADRGASYWSRLAGEVKAAQEAYFGLEVVPPPAGFSGPLPQIVHYEAGVPRVLGRGAYEVSSVLSRISRNEPL